VSPDRTAPDAPAIDYTIDDDGMVAFTPSGNRYRVEPASYSRNVIHVEIDGAVRHLDAIDVKNDLARARFIKALGKRVDVDLDVVRVELMAIATNIDLIAPPGTDSVSAGAPIYTVDDRGIFYTRTIPSTPPRTVEQPVSNFGAHIDADITISDGIGDRREYEIDCWQGEFRKTATVPAAKFANVQEWITEALGSQAVVYPGSRHLEHVATAIQLNKPIPVRKLVFGHTGVRQLEDGQMGYLTASGAITGDGLRDEIAVHLESPLNRYHLPAPPTGDEERAAWRATMELLDLADRSVTIPLLGAAVRSVFGPSDFAIYIMGGTGLGKTTLVALFLSLFGAKLDADHLPASFSGTGNSIEMIAYLLKDALLVVDDFQRNKAINADATAERIGRALGNQSGRTRLTREAQLRAQKPPRGTVMMTGEDIPKGESLRARMSIIELKKGSVRFKDGALTEAQDRGHAGVHASAMAAFIRWFVGDYAARIADFTARFEAMRLALQTDHAAHPRTVTTAAHLMAAYSMLSDYLGSIGWTEDELAKLAASAEQELRGMIAAQAEHLRSANPVTQFLEALDAILVSGEAHLVDSNGDAPSDPEAWGWRRVDRGTTVNGNPTDPEWRPQGSRIGWTTGDGAVYLEWNAAYQIIQKRAVAIGTEIPLTPDTLLKRFWERGLIVTRDEARETFKVRRRLMGANRNVVHLRYPVEGGEA
jgi:hypothetical protein